MSVQSRTRVIVAFVVIGIAAVAATRLPMRASSTSSDPRELNLVVRDMTFYVEGQQEPNPTIVLRAGEQVRLRVRNEDAGMRHDFVVRAWTVGTRMLEDRGQEDTIVFRVPDTKGTAAYTCTPHPKMMSGMLRVE
jgi:plastocyanin